jgi:flagellum-specific peptidoglycan hydrolase FlgJ
MVTINDKHDASRFQNKDYAIDNKYHKLLISIITTFHRD